MASLLTVPSRTVPPLVRARRVLRAVVVACTGATLVLAAAGPADAEAAPPPAPTRTTPADARQDVDEVRRRLDTALVPLVRPYDMGVSIVDHRTGARWSYRGGKQNNMASLTKLATGVGVLLLAADRHRDVTPAQRALLRRALQVSDNAAQNALWAAVGGHAGFARVAARLRLRHTAPVFGRGWGRTLSTADDQVRLMETLLAGAPPIGPTAAAWILATMEGVSADQTWGAAPFGRAPGRVIRVKNGWSPYRDTGLWRLTSLGHIRDAHHDYTVAILSDGWRSPGAGIPRLDAVGRATFRALGAR